MANDVFSSVVPAQKGKREHQFIPFVQALGEILQLKGWLIATAESCTGGEVAQMITSLAGSSRWFERGFVTYSNDAKIEMLGVKVDSLATYGAVSEVVVREMAEGVLRQSHADVGLAVTGIAGPSGGTPEKPLGTVWFAWAGKQFSTQSELQVFEGDRIKIRDAAALFGLKRLLEIIRQL